MGFNSKHVVFVSWDSAKY